MDTEEYYQQLQAINQMLEECPEGTERSELISLKQNIEELLSLTATVTKQTKTLCVEDEPILISDENEQNHSTDDDEYALFMAEMAKEGAIELPNGSTASSDRSQGSHATLISSTSFKHLEGKKFKAPHKHQWGQVVYHNAMVCSVPNEIPVNNEFQVKVLFLNPTHKEMQPCPFYFHLEKNCNYTEEECRYSHGEFVPFSSLQDYVEPKFELLTVGSDILAKQSNDLWYRAKITQIFKEKCLVKFDSKNVQNQLFEEVIFSHILPLETSENDTDNVSGSDSDGEVLEEDFDIQIENDHLEAKRRHKELINMSLMNVPETQQLGNWEKYTKGIGSKLMQKMGYVVGTGLGKKGSGIIKPVTALILPQGKSLDYCMNLKEKWNNPDLFSADQKATKPAKRELKRKKRLERQVTRKAEALIRIEQMDIAKFLQHRYACKKVSWAQSEDEEFQFMREKLKSSSDKDVNAANYMVDEKVKRYKGVVVSLKSTIKRLEEVHSATEKLHNRLRTREFDLKNLTTYKMMIKNEIDRRKNNKEMAVF